MERNHEQESTQSCQYISRIDAIFNSAKLPDRGGLAFFHPFNHSFVWLKATKYKNLINFRKKFKKPRNNTGKIKSQ